MPTNKNDSNKSKYSDAVSAYDTQNKTKRGRSSTLTEGGTEMCVWFCLNR